MAHGKGMKSYLIMMTVRLLEMKRILKDTGSIYLHCDTTASHYLKMTMDVVFGKDNFRNEIVWCYKRMASKNQNHFSKCHDILLCYGRTSRSVFNPDSVRLPYSESSKQRAGYKKTSLGGGAPESGVCELNIKGRFPEDWWDIPIIRPNAKERVGYPTQKPLKLLNKIIKASSNEGDIVLDPFCGCATSCVASERLDRQWVGIDLSIKAAELVQVRIRKEIDLFHNFTPIQRSDIPKRTDLGALPNYRTHKHKLYGKQEGKCSGCLVLFEYRNMTVDHIIPKSKGGGATTSTTCNYCVERVIVLKAIGGTHI